MNKKNNLANSYLMDNFKNEANKNFDKKNIKEEKVLCNHCGRTSNNGIRCLGICVADNDY